MASMNKIIMIGNLTSEVDNRVCRTGLNVATFNIAINEKNKNGDVTTFVNIKCFGKVAEICSQYLNKGSAVLIEGKYRTETWEDRKTGTKRYSNYILAEAVQFIGGRQNSSEKAIETKNTGFCNSPIAPQSKYSPDDMDFSPPDDDSDVVPF